MSYPALSILIPAAGASERLGQAKQLVEYQGKSLIQNAVNSAHLLNPNEILVITGADEQLIRNAVQQPPVRWINNPNWDAGMGGSIALGATAISPECKGLMILLCDQWRINTQNLQELADTWQSDPQRIVVAQAQGHYMPPVIFPSSCFAELSGMQGKQGARSLFKAHHELLKAVPMDNAAFDLDTKNQLDELKKDPG